MLQNIMEVLNTSNEYYSMILAIITSFAFIYATIQCFFGLKLFKVIIAISGGLIGLFAGIKLGDLLDITILSYIFGAILAVIFVILAVKFYKVGVFLYGFGVGTILGIILSSFNLNYIIYSLLFGIVVGILSVIFLKPVIIATSAISGGAVMASSILSLFTPNPALIVTILLSVVFALLGGFCQYKLSKKSIAKSDADTIA